MRLRAAENELVNLVQSMGVKSQSCNTAKLQAAIISGMILSIEPLKWIARGTRAFGN
jgi:hypothetical protein